jgi:hypothetical protein
MKRNFEVWGWGARVLAHSLSGLVVLAAFLGLWALAAYEWLWIPESSVFLLTLSLVWAIGQVLAAAAALAGSVAGAVQVASEDARALSFAVLVRLGRKRFAETLVWLVAASAIGLALAEFFGWVNQRSIELASFLTFHFEAPVGHLMIDRWITAVECLIWVAIVGSLLGFLTVLFRSGWQQARRQIGKVLLAGCFGIPFWTGFLSVVVFGGSAYVLANWRPTVAAGFWDYSQLALRVTLVLILLAAGWLFWLLCLARLNSPTVVASYLPEHQQSATAHER